MKTRLILFALVIILVLHYLLYPLPPRDYARVTNRTLYHDKTLLIIQDTVRYPAMANVTKMKLDEEKVKIGVATQKYELNFGTVPRGVTVRKVIKLRNNEPRPAKIKFKACGSIKPFITFQENDVVLNPSEYREFEVSFNAGRVGNFTGAVDVIIKVPRYDFLIPIMGLM